MALKAEKGRIGTNLKNSLNVFLLDRKATVEVRESADKKSKKLFLLKVQVLIRCVHKSFCAKTVMSLCRDFSGTGRT